METALPDFSCADLRDASFERRILFAINPDYKDHRAASLTTWHNANLETTNLSNFGILVGSTKGSDPMNDPLFRVSTQQSVGTDGRFVYVVQETGGDWLPENNTPSIYQRNFSLVLTAMADGRGINKAMLSDGMKSYSHTHPVTVSEISKLANDPCEVRKDENAVARK